VPGDPGALNGKQWSPAHCAVRRTHAANASSISAAIRSGCVLSEKVPGPLDRHECDVRASLELPALVRQKLDIVLLAEDDPGSSARVAEPGGEVTVLVVVAEHCVRVAANEATVVSPELGGERCVAVLGYAALRHPADQLQHDHVGEMPEHERTLARVAGPGSLVVLECLPRRSVEGGGQGW
jgi:hypothetical protein